MMDELPLGFAMALAQHPKAMRLFPTCPKGSSSNSSERPTRFNPARSCVPWSSAWSPGAESAPWCTIPRGSLCQVQGKGSFSLASRQAVPTGRLFSWILKICDLLVLGFKRFSGFPLPGQNRGSPCPPGGLPSSGGFSASVRGLSGWNLTVISEFGG